MLLGSVYQLGIDIKKKLESYFLERTREGLSFDTKHVFFLGEKKTRMNFPSYDD